MMMVMGKLMMVAPPLHIISTIGSGCSISQPSLLGVGGGEVSATRDITP